MKRLALFVLIGLFAFVSQAQEAENEAPVVGAYLVFDESEFDFGDIHQGDQVEHVFNFQNQGTKPLILSNVATTCGCTAPYWPKEPIPPGEKGEIKVKFNSSGKMGRQNKIITVYSNSSQSMTRVKIVTNVLPPKKTETEG